jgi:hypothetical protein
MSSARWLARRRCGFFTKVVSLVIAWILSTVLDSY